MILKKQIRSVIKSKLHLVDEQRFAMVNSIVTKGLPSFLELSFEDLKHQVAQFCPVVKCEGFSYKYSPSRKESCIYASVYAVLLKGLLRTLPNEEERIRWGAYLNKFQSPQDGLYYDPALQCDAFEHIGSWNEGWGKHHLFGHILIVLARLEVLPKYPLKFLEWSYDTDNLVRWMEHFDFAGDVWTVSNYFMNLYTALEYARDYLNEERAEKSVQTIADWLLKHQNPRTGMWHTDEWDKIDRQGRLTAVRAAYHFYPLFEYEEIEVPHAGNVVDSILPLQNAWGGWTTEGFNSGACEDIDAIEPLIRFAPYRPERRKEIEAAIKRSLIWQLACQNPDGGFSFYCQAGQEYGGHPLTTSIRGESSMFGTWFRLLCIAYEMRFLGLKNEFDIGRFPGYEIK